METDDYMDISHEKNKNYYNNRIADTFKNNVVWIAAPSSFDKKNTVVSCYGDSFCT